MRRLTNLALIRLDLIILFSPVQVPPPPPHPPLVGGSGVAAPLIAGI